MKRVIWLVLDSFGIGNAPDAAEFGDAGADTFGHIATQRPLNLPNLTALGLLNAYERNNATTLPLLNTKRTTLPGAFWGAAREASANKDTLTGHWEMAGVAMDVAMHHFPVSQPTFPAELIEAIIARAADEGIVFDGILGDRHASGIEVIDTLGAEHIRTGRPILYTSADSVIQIAAHEEHFGLDRLYRLCEITREIANPYAVGRIIARPFIGDEANGFARTKNRHDYALRPSGTSVLEYAHDAAKPVIGIGKIPDIFGGHGITASRPAYKLDGLMDETLTQMDALERSGIIMTNFVDFDMEWGHRRDVEGYAAGLEYFDTRLPELLDRLRDDDLLILTADHGCDPTWHGTDHTRENVPVFGMLRTRDIGEIGIRESFADMAATISEYLEIAQTEQGRSFLST
jgi:phosphopentomutase